MKHLILIILILCLWATTAHAAFSLLREDQLYQCLSTDTKLTTGIVLGSRLFETDTGKKYTFDGTSWVLGGFNEASVNPNYPISVDGDSVYEKDINVATSDIGGFSGEVVDLFNDVSSVVVDSAATNPKEISIKLNRPMDGSIFRLCTKTGTFSNVKIILKTAAGTTVATIDDSADSTALQDAEYVVDGDPVAFCNIVIQFHTANTVTMGYVAIDKAIHTHSISQGIRSDGTLGFVGLTNGNNQKISIEERENTLVFDDYLEIARGNISGITKVNKYGLATNGIQTTATDIWDRADAAATQQIWLAPTAARIHEILSTSDADSDTGGVIAQGAGCRTLRLWGLADWDTAESSEDIIMDGTDGTDTVGSYVIIHRMKCLTYSTSGPNAGIITAVAAVNATVTAQIGIGNGQTLMAIYGIPSTQTAYMTGYDVSAHEAGTVANPNETDFELLINEIPDVLTTKFINKSNIGLMAVGTSAYHKEYRPYKTIAGPAIIKFQATATTADSEAVAEFDLILVDN